MRAAKKLSPGAQVMALSGVAGTGVTDVLRALHVHVRAHPDGRHDQRSDDREPRRHAQAEEMRQEIGQKPEHVEKREAIAAETEAILSRLGVSPAAWQDRARPRRWPRTTGSTRCRRVGSPIAAQSWSASSPVVPWVTNVAKRRAAFSSL